MRSRIILLLFCLPLLLSSCGSDPNAPNAGCDGNVLVGVTSGVTPLIRWWPGCAVYTVFVTAGVPPHTFEQFYGSWAVESERDSEGLPNNRLHSGIQYGEAPPGSGQVTVPAPLVQGQVYTVYLNVYTIDQRVVNVGRATFTP